jgi:hypothetical protein
MQLVSYADPTQHDLLSLVRSHYEIWAARHGYQTQIITDPVDVGDRSPHWAKIALLRELIADDDLLWLDCDVVLQSDNDPWAEIRDEDFQALVMEQTPHGPGPNTGVWCLRSCPETRSFLDAVWAGGQQSQATLHDQAAVAQLLGWSVLPQQTKPLHYSSWLAHTGWLDYRWNMQPTTQLEAYTVAWGLHFAGLPLANKHLAISQQLITQRLPGWRTLVPPELVAQWSDRRAYPHPAE